MSALDMAKEKNSPEVCELLQKHGAKPGGPGSQVQPTSQQLLMCTTTAHFKQLVTLGTEARHC